MRCRNLAPARSGAAGASRILNRIAASCLGLARARVTRVALSLDGGGEVHSPAAAAPSPAAGSSVSEMELMHQRWLVGTG